MDQLGDNSGEVVPFDVDVTTLDSFGFSDVDILKIDAEGSEPFIFRGACETIARSPRLTAVVEYWPKFFAKAGEDAAEFLRERIGMTELVLIKDAA